MNADPITLVLAIAPIAVGALGAYVRNHIHALSTRFTARERLDAKHRDAETHLAVPVQRLATQIAAAEDVASRPGELADTFEAGVHLVRRLGPEHEQATAARIARATAVLRHLRGLPSAVREQAVANLYEVHRVPKKPNGGTGPGTVGSLMGLLACLAAMEPACAPPSEPRHELVLCDPTGPAEAQLDICNTKTLAEAFLAWARRAISVPGSRFVVFESAGSFADVRTIAEFTVPPRARGAIRATQRRWIEASLATLSAVQLNVDTPDNYKVNKSNVLAGLLAAARFATLDLTGDVELLVYSDGWSISYGFNTERVVPAAQEVVAVLQQLGVGWDLSRFSRLFFCGLHHRGADAAHVAARDLFWRDMLALGQATAVEFRATCVAAYPPVPASLLRGTDRPDPGDATPTVGTPQHHGLRE